MRHARLSAILTFLVTFFFAALTSVHARDWFTVDGQPAAVSEAILDKAISYASAKDNAALEKLMDAGVLFFLKGGLRVQLIETKGLGDKIKIRTIGSTTEIWTVRKGIE